MTTLTIEQILAGTGLGRPQSVGQMDVLPLFDEGGAQDESFAPPDMEVGTSDYGTLNVRNTHPSRPTIVPTGAGWVTDQRAQDHAVPSAALVGPGASKTTDRAMCIESSQGGLIRGATEFLVLPAQLRPAALNTRHNRGYDRLWGAIGQLNESLGVQRGGGHLVRFLKHYQDELDQFVAQFELLPNQIGAVILIGGNVVGIERAPNVAFWERLWVPLVRVCYGSLALKARQILGDTPPATRAPLQVEERTLDGLRNALEASRKASVDLTTKALETVSSAPLLFAGDVDDQLGGAEVMTVANRHVAGQLVTKDGKTPYASLSAAGA